MAIQPYFNPANSRNTPLFASFLNGFMQRRTATNMMILNKYLEGADTKFLSKHIEVLEENKKEYIKQMNLNLRESAKNRSANQRKFMETELNRKKANQKLQSDGNDRYFKVFNSIMSGTTAKEIGGTNRQKKEFSTELDTKLQKSPIEKFVIKKITDSGSSGGFGGRDELSFKEFEGQILEPFAKNQNLTVGIANKSLYTSRLMADAFALDIKDRNQLIESPGAIIKAAEISGLDPELVTDLIIALDSSGLQKLFAEKANMEMGSGPKYLDLLEMRKKEFKRMESDLPGFQNYADTMQQASELEEEILDIDPEFNKSKLLMKKLDKMSPVAQQRTQERFRKADEARKNKKEKQRKLNLLQQKARDLKPGQEIAAPSLRERRRAVGTGYVPTKSLKQRIAQTQFKIDKLEGQRYKLIQEHSKRGRDVGYFGPFEKNYLLDNPFKVKSGQQRDLDKYLGVHSIMKTMPDKPQNSPKYNTLQQGYAYDITTKTGGVFRGGVTKNEKPFLEQYKNGNVYRKEIHKHEKIYKQLEDDLMRFNKEMSQRLK